MPFGHLSPKIVYRETPKFDRRSRLPLDNPRRSNFGASNWQRLRIHLIDYAGSIDHENPETDFLGLDGSGHQALMRFAGTAIFLLEDQPSIEEDVEILVTKGKPCLAKPR